MTIPSEFTQEFASFPEVLRHLVEAELAAGNAIVAIEHGFPAAPCGASIRLAQAVNEERRESAAGVSFYARNNSSHAGEFTTAERHFFVLEPPLPPEPEPDMDAIRESLTPKPSPLAHLAERSPGAMVADLLGTQPQNPAEGSPRPAATRAFTNIETPAGWTRVLHFIDQRPPHEVQFALERDVRALFSAGMDGGWLRMKSAAKVNGARYDFDLQFLAAGRTGNHFALHITASWAGSAESHHDYFRRTSDSWFSSWTRDLLRANPPDAGDNQEDRYHQLCADALRAEVDLDSAAAVRRAIVDGVRRGGSYSDSHKEGGTNIYCRNGGFVRSDYGDDPGFKVYQDEAEFLDHLWRYCQFDINRHDLNRELSEYDAWKLILRRMDPPAR